MLARNDNWETPLAAQPGQSVATGADLAAAALATGAFALAPGGKDAALIITLTPGNYSAQVTGAAPTATGAALVEIYEIP